MRRALTVILAGALVLPLVSCDKLGEMMGKKAAPTEAELKQQQSELKLKEMEAKVLQMEAEAKARKEAEEKAKAEEELKAKIAAEVKAQAETQPAAPAAAATTTPPAATPAAPAPAPTKVVERVIVKEVPAPAPSAPAASTPSKASGYVRLYDDAGFTDRILTVRFGRDIGNMHYVSSDDGKSGFNDKASSVKWSVPAGWQAVLYENNNYSKRGYVLKGSGSTPDLGYFGDKCSSIRWEKAGD
jgi:hypothetical protein